MTVGRDFYQYAYVTGDLAAASREIRALHGLGPLKEMLDLNFTMGPGREARAHFALAFKDGLQFEIIQPLDGDVAAYRQTLDGPGPVLRFHHLGRHFDSPEDCQTVVAEMRPRWPMVMEFAGYGGYCCYFDARATFGHHLEFFSFPVGAPILDVPYY